MPVDEALTIYKNRLQPANGGNGKRISIVTGIHGDELEGQYVCYELQRRIALAPGCLKGVVDITTNTSRVDKHSARQAEEAILNFMNRRGLISYHAYEGYVSRVIDSKELLTVRAERSGFLDVAVAPGDRVDKDQLLAKILDTYTGDVLQELRAPDFATVFFAGDDATVFERTAAFKLIREEE